MQVLPSTILAHLVDFLDPKSATVLSTASKDQRRVLNGQFAHGVCMFCNVRLEPRDMKECPQCSCREYRANLQHRRDLLVEQVTSSEQAIDQGMIDDILEMDIDLYYDCMEQAEEERLEKQAEQDQQRHRRLEDEYNSFFRQGAGHAVPSRGDWIGLRDGGMSLDEIHRKWEEYEGLYRLPREAGWLMQTFFNREVHGASFRGPGENLPVSGN